MESSPTTARNTRIDSLIAVIIIKRRLQSCPANRGQKEVQKINRNKQNCIEISRA